MSEQTCRNKFDSRCGFSKFGDDQTVAQVNRLASQAMKNRIKFGYFKNSPKMSHVLKYQKKIPHAIGSFVKKDGSACALGVLHLKAGGKKYEHQPDWEKIDGHYQLVPEETHRQVVCPVCSQYPYPDKNRDNIMARIFHLNDFHGMSTWNIGNWLEEFNL